MPRTLRIHQEDSPPCVTVQVEGTLDAAAAAELRASLEALPAPELVVDFSRVQHFQDAAVAVLTPALAGRAHRLLGLGPHQVRVFRCFGLCAERAR
jgi:anti-anti-sigma regulatory factor